MKVSRKSVRKDAAELGELGVGFVVGFSAGSRCQDPPDRHGHFLRLVTSRKMRSLESLESFNCTQCHKWPEESYTSVALQTKHARQRHEDFNRHRKNY